MARFRAAVERFQAAEANQDDVRLESSLRTLIELQPDEIQWRLNLCRLLARQGRSSAVVETCRAALPRALAPKDAIELRVRMGEASIRLGDAAQARAALEPLLNQSPRPPWVDPLWAKVLRLEGKSDQALEYLRRSLPAGHQNASAYQLIGMLEFDLGHYGAAFNDLRQSARLDPYSDVTQFKLAECARMLGDRAAERAYRNEYVRLHAIYQELDALTNRHLREKSLSRDDASRCADLYESIGQMSQARVWRQKASAMTLSR